MKALLILLLIISNITSASSIKTLGEEANDALRHISHCTKIVSKVLIKGAWIGKTELWENENNNYGYHYHVFNTDWSNFSTIKVGVIRLFGKYIPEPMADASSYDYSCKFTKE